VRVVERHTCLFHHPTSLEIQDFCSPGPDPWSKPFLNPSFRRQSNNGRDRGAIACKKNKKNCTRQRERAFSKNACCHVFFSGFLILPSLRSKPNRMHLPYGPCSCRPCHVVLRGVGIDWTRRLLASLPLITSCHASTLSKPLRRGITVCVATLLIFSEDGIEMQTPSSCRASATTIYHTHTTSPRAPRPFTGMTWPWAKSRRPHMRTAARGVLSRAYILAQVARGV